jgi:hypothetical protein
MGKNWMTNKTSKKVGDARFIPTNEKWTKLSQKRIGKQRPLRKSKRDEMYPVYAVFLMITKRNDER